MCVWVGGYVYGGCACMRAYVHASKPACVHLLDKIEASARPYVPPTPGVTVLTCTSHTFYVLFLFLFYYLLKSLFMQFCAASTYAALTTTLGSKHVDLFLRQEDVSMVTCKGGREATTWKKL